MPSRAEPQPSLTIILSTSDRAAPECDADANFASPSARRERQDAVEARRGEQQADPTERRRHDRTSALRQQHDRRGSFQVTTRGAGKIGSIDTHRLTQVFGDSAQFHLWS